MKAFLIDPQAQTITEVEYSGDYTEIYKHIGADMFDVVRINRNGDCIFVDDEGLLKEPEHFFAHTNYPNPLAGRGLVLGTDDEGDSAPPKVTLEKLREDVVFVDRAMIAMAYRIRKMLDEQMADRP